jgi:two-component system, OmpR family, phosphate regulon response regulator PhoB
MNAASTAQSDEADRVLVVEDEEDLRNLVAFNVRSAGFVVEGAATGALGLAAARATKPVVVVLDLMLPDMLGTAVCAAIRHDPELADVGILMLTARGGDYDRIQGLEAGADDYVVKPFNVRELVLRVRALAKRSRTARLAKAARPKVYRWRGLEVEIARHRVVLDGAPLALRPLEFKLLATLLGAPGTIFSRAELMRLVWGTDEETDSRTVDTHVRRLRERLGACGDGLETVHRFGYRWQEETGDGAVVEREQREPSDVVTRA